MDIRYSAQQLATARGYLAPHRSADDTAPHWHGTFVSGLALYGDCPERYSARAVRPQLRLFSGKVFEDDGQGQRPSSSKKAVEEAVRDLHAQYGCRVFNQSYGDLNKVYDGRHVRGLAYTLDRLTRELGVLFVVPAGNLLSSSCQPMPALPRLHARGPAAAGPPHRSTPLTVGGLSLNEATRNAQRYPNTIEDHVLARAEQPFPLTRSGPSASGAIKPDVVAHARNIALRRTGRGRPCRPGSGSLNGGFARGRRSRKTSAPAMPHPKSPQAARILAEVPDASPNLLRALSRRTCPLAASLRSAVEPWQQC